MTMSSVILMAYEFSLQRSQLLSAPKQHFTPPLVASAPVSTARRVYARPAFHPTGAAALKQARS